MVEVATGRGVKPPSDRAQRPAPLLFGAARSAKHCRRQPAQPIELFCCIVFYEPGLGQRGEDVLVEAPVTQAAIETFDEGVLHGLAGRVVVPLDPEIGSPA